MAVDIVGAVLALLYTFVLCLGLNQLYRLMNSKNNKLSLRTGILCFLTLGPVIRVAFWCKVGLPAGATQLYKYYFKSCFYF